MNEKTILLTQIDSWFFRDGRPFNMNEFSQSDINSLFPPNPQTVVGAIRAALARANGWNGCGSWSSEIASWLGDGQNLGKLRFKGPYLMKDGACLFPAPLYFGRYKKEDELGKDVSRCNNCFGLAELGSEVECDLGMVRLPKFEKYKKNAECKGKEKNTKCKWKPFDKAYLTKENMELVLKGEISDGIKIVESKDLWSNEYRLGIELEKQKKTTKEGALYSTNHIRLKKGVGLGVVVGGIDEKLKTEGIIPFGAESRLTNLEFKEVGVDSLISRNAKKVKKENGKLENGIESKLWIDNIIPFGGESRLANVELSDKGISLPTGPKADELNKDNGRVKFTVVHITPAYFDKLPHFGEKLPEIEGRVVFAFLGRPTKIGGWDSVRNEPLPLKACIPAGSAWFCEADAKYAKDIVGMNGGQIGEMKEFGFGQILIGKW